MANMSVVKPTENELSDLGVDNWGIWEKEESVFDWSYDTGETCYILEGSAQVESIDGEIIKFTKGDLVRFPKGLECKWEITEKIRKRYKFE